MFFQRNGLAEPLDLQQFTFDHRLGQIDERVEDVKVTLLHGDFEGLHVEPVTGENALGIAPLRVGGRAPASRLGFVDDVVVDQRRGVDDFDYRSQLDRPVAGVVHQLAGEQQQRRTQPFAAAGAEVLADLRDRPHAGHRVAAELALDGREVVVQQVKYFFSVAGYGRIQTDLPCQLDR